MPTHYDNGTNFNSIESAEAYVHGGEDSNTSKSYHTDRMRALRVLVSKIPISEPVRIYNFGCGDNMEIREFFSPDKVEMIVGHDISAPMIELSKKNMKDYNFYGVCAGVEAISDFGEEQFDMIFAIDVLGYLSNEDLEIFYSSVNKIAKKGGHLFLMTGNELFDLYALNAGTVEFFRKYFQIDVAAQITEGAAPQYKPASRRNPLSSKAELARYGFEEVDLAFSQWHKTSPSIGNKVGGDLAKARMVMRDHVFNPNALPEVERWKAMLRCSIFASLSRKI